jgi:Protein of unknown function (DUF1761)
MDPTDVQWGAVAVAALASFLVGALWYSPLMFARPWMVDVGLSREALERGGLGRIFAGSALAAVVIATNLAFFLGPDPSIAWGAGAGALAGIGWVATALTTTYLFERRPLRLLAIDAGYHAATFTLMGLILGAWP